MSAPVDVLAVMDRAIAADPHRGMQEARAAVAELIEAARDYDWVIENAYDVTQTAPARARLRAALARVKGVQS